MKKSILFLGLFIILSLLLLIPQTFASDLEDSIIIIESGDFEKTKETVKHIRNEGGRVDAVFIPNIIIAKLPQNRDKINKIKNIQKISNKEINLSELDDYDKNQKMGIKVWNKRFKKEKAAKTIGKGNKTPGPILNDRIMEAYSLENEDSKKGGLEFIQNAPPNSGKADYLYGDVLTSINFLESDGTLDPSTEDWTSIEETNVFTEVASGLTWWTNNKPSNVDLTMYYTFNYGVPTKYEPINRPSSDKNLWINDALDYLGEPSNPSYIIRLRDYDNSIRESFGMDWAFSVFVVDSSNDIDGLFTDGLFAFATCIFGQTGCEFVVMTYDNNGYGISNMDSVLAHESGHIFGANDQYASSGCIPSEKSGFLQVENQNCENGGSSNVPSIMRGGISPYTNNQIDYYAKGQVGWRDLDGDGTNDAIDSTYNSDPDNDGDGIVDYWDTDDDNDGVLDVSDNCQFTSNPTQTDTDGDGQGDACDTDDDNDGILDVSDSCPLTVGIAYYAGCPDTFAPSVLALPASLGAIQPGGVITLQVSVFDPSGISTVSAQIESPDENIITTLTLYDDGTHGDNGAGDGIYGNIWNTPVENDYLVDVYVSDTIGNDNTLNNIIRFSTYNFNVNSKLLLIHDDSTPYYTFYQNAISNNNINYDFYNLYLKGSPYSSLFQNYEVIVWAIPNDWTTTFSTVDQLNLQNYLDNGGKLFVSGQDVGYDLTQNGGISNSFYSNYLHASYVQDDVNYAYLNGVIGDAIGDGLSFGISGGDGANNQFYSDEIDPINGAQSIFLYTDSLPAPPINIELSNENSKLEKESDQIYGISKSFLPQIQPELIQSAPSSSGSGALKIDTGVYKVVYFAFGFEAINNQNDRDTTMYRVLNWLADLIPPVISNEQPLSGSTVTSSSIILSVDTDEIAECRYSTSSGQTFDSMTLFTTTDSTSHSLPLTVVDEATYNYYIKCKDNNGNINANDYYITFLADWNNNPSIISTAVTIATEDSLYSYDVDAQDSDYNPTDILVYSLNVNPTGMTIDSNTGIITWTPDNLQVGDNAVIVQVDDSNGGIDTQSFTVTVSEVNDPPIVLNILDFSFDEDTIDTSINLDIYINDEDNTNAEITWTASGNTNIDVLIDPVSHVVTFTPNTDWFGVETITFTACDLEPLCNSNDVIVTVNSINDIPTINPLIPDQTQDEDISLDLDLSIYENDVEDSDLSLDWSVSGADPTLFTTSFDANLNILTITPIQDTFGSDLITLTLTDSNGATVTQDITITINSINDLPIIEINSPVNGTIFTDGDLITFTGTANDVEDGDISNNINWVSTINNAMGTFATNDINSLSIGKHTITASAIDSNTESAQSSIIIYINAIGNTAPIANAGVDQSINTNSLVTLDGSASSDAENNTLTYLWTQTSGPSVTLSDTGLINPAFTPTADGTYEFSLIVNDGIFDSNVDTIIVTSTTPTPPDNGGSGGGGGGGGGGGSASGCSTTLKTLDDPIIVRAGCTLKFEYPNGVDNILSIDEVTVNDLTASLNEGSKNKVNIYGEGRFSLNANEDLLISYAGLDYGKVSLTLNVVEALPEVKEEPASVQAQKITSEESEEKIEEDVQPETNKITGAVVIDKIKENKGTIIPVSILIILGIIGYFGYTKFGKSIKKKIKKIKK